MTRSQDAGPSCLVCGRPESAHGACLEYIGPPTAEEVASWGPKCARCGCYQTHHDGERGLCTAGAHSWSCDCAGFVAASDRPGREERPELDVEAIRARAEYVKRGGWADARLIENIRTDVPALCDEVERLHEELATKERKTVRRFAEWLQCLGFSDLAERAERGEWRKP